MASHSPTHKSKEEKEKRKSAAKAKIRAIGMVQAAFKRAQQRQGTESPEPVNSGEEPRLTWRERMAERAKERGGTIARGGDETARSSRTFSDPPSDPQSTHQWQARKLEERAKVEKRRKEEARALTRRDADRRARSSDRGQDPFEAELDRMSDAEAMNRLDDVPISDLDTDYSSDERGASRRGGGRATDNDDSDLDDGLTPMERAMARAARARAASAGEESSGGELPERPAARKDPPPAPRHPPPPRDFEEPRERRGGDAESRAIDADERARRAEAELADARSLSEDAADDDAGAAPNQASDVGVTETTIRIGNITAENGVLGDTFAPAVQGLRAWAAHTNANGGINGRQIELFTCDDREDRARTLECARRLVPVCTEIENELGVPIVNKRVSVTPIGLLVGATGADDVMPVARALDAEEDEQDEADGDKEDEADGEEKGEEGGRGAERGGGGGGAGC